ncbi:phage portal protein [Mesorhizobium sediminum]|nr:phage portal protein [Mesorhizobium sediminum]
MVDLDRLSTPPGMIESRRLRAGVAKNGHGAPIGYHIRKAHPNEWLDADSYQWKYIPSHKPWGRVQMIHIFESMRPDQTRGVAEMASALLETKIARNFRKVALQRAIVDATYAASIESELPTEAVYQVLGAGNMSATDVQKAIQGYATGYLNSINEYSGAKGHKIDGVKIPHFFPGTKLNIRPAGHGGPLGTEFEQSLLRYIAANLGISYEQLSRDYSKTNYSSAKAAMAETWKFMQSRKKVIADRFASHIYMLWLEEAISKGHIDSLPRNAPNFWEGLNREAYSACEWIGASRGQIDELKETQAAVLRIKYHLTTYEDDLPASARIGARFSLSVSVSRRSWTNAVSPSTSKTT